MGEIVNLRTLCVLALALGGFSFTEARSKGNPIRDVPLQDIPARCITNTVTSVVCDKAVSSDNLVPHPDDCQLFYYCVTAYLPPICRQCPAGLHFNPNKHVCDLPEQAGCQSSISSTDSTTEEAVFTTQNYQDNETGTSN